MPKFFVSTPDKVNTQIWGIGRNSPKTGSWTAANRPQAILSLAVEGCDCTMAGVRLINRASSVLGVGVAAAGGAYLLHQYFSSPKKQPAH